MHMHFRAWRYAPAFHLSPPEAYMRCRAHHPLAPPLHLPLEVGVPITHLSSHCLPMLSSGENMLPYLARPSFVLDDQRWKPDVELPPSCPRCDSSNTKFCYYNNYSLSQPRYFCKGCRRYWTKGGSLRNVPVGGGCRKNRRAKSARSSTGRGPSREYSTNMQRCSVRPDLALDDPLGSSCRSSGSRTVSSSMDASASDGSNIDLALLYSRFLNQCSANFDPELAAPEVPVDMDSDHQLPLQPPLLQGDGAPDLQRLPADMFLETQFLSNEFLPAAGDLGICLDSNSCCVPQMLPAEGFGYDDVFCSASSTVAAAGLTWQCPPPQSPGMAAVQEDHQQLHSNLYGSSWDAFGLTNYD